MKRPFWRGSCAGDTKLSLGPDHDLGQTKWTKVDQKTIILEAKWTEVVTNLIEATSLEGFSCKGAQN